MVTQAEETQAKEFLKRAEIRTMKKDLLSLREVDALKERNKIATIKTLEEQLEEQKNKNTASASAKATADKEKAGREEVLTKNEGEERIAEKDLKNYGTEQERQQMFLFESQRLGFEKQVDSIDKEKDPALKLEKNNLLLKVRDWQTKLNSILEDEKKLEDEQKFLGEKAQSTTVATERKGLEQSRWDLDEKIKGVEKKRWEAEKQIESLNNRVSEIDKSSLQLVAEKNELRNKILGVDKELREIYSVIISREEQKRRGNLEGQKAEREAAAKVREEKNEQVQRQQWFGTSAKRQPKDEGYLSKAPKNIQEKIMKIGATEEDERKKFLQDVTSWSETGGKNIEKTAQQKSVEPSVLQKETSETPKPPAPPVPHKK